METWYTSHLARAWYTGANMVKKNRTARKSTESLRIFLLALPFAIYAGLILSYIDHIPLWDSFWYAEELYKAINTAPFDLGKLNLIGHLTIGYTIFLWPILTLFPSFSSVILANMAGGMLAIFYFQKLLKRIAPHDLLIQVAGTILLTTNPLFLTNTINPSPDFYTVVFFIPFLHFLLEKRLWGILVMGTLISLSKETGFFMYCTSIAAYVIVCEKRSIFSAQDLKRHIPLLVPVFTFVATGLLFTIVFDSNLMIDPAVWKRYFGTAIGERLVNGKKAISMNLLLLTFLLQFAWAHTLVILASACIGLWNAFRVRTFPVIPREAFFLFLVLASSLITLRIPDFSNPRYALLTAPLLLLLSMRGLSSHFPHIAKKIIACAMIAATWISILHSVDPVSKALFGTFPYGSREMFSIGRRTAECCGNGRDQLLYNLETAYVSKLFTHVIEDILSDPTVPDVIALDAMMVWKLPRCASNTTGKAMINCTNEPSIQYYDPRGVLNHLPARVEFIITPHQTGTMLSELLNAYSTERSTRYEISGYSIDVLSLLKK